MFFKIFGEMYKHFPKLKVGVLIAEGIDNSKKNRKVASLFEEAVEYIRLTSTAEKDVDPKLIPKHMAKSPLISAWRAEYEEYGIKEHYRSNVETISSNILAGNMPKSRNNLRDMCTYLSLKEIVPMGVYDLDKIEGDIYLGLANGGERFLPVDSKGAEKVNKKEVVYSDAAGILCRRWNWKESRRAQVTEQTKNAIVFFVALPPIMKADIRYVLSEASELISMACGGKLGHRIASKKKLTVEI